MEKNDTRIKIYELGYLFVPSIAEENVAAEVQAVKSIIEKYEGNIITEDFPKLRPLAYAMSKVVGAERSKFDKGYFGWIKFEISSGSVPQIKTELDKNNIILRFMIIETIRENTMVTQKMIFKPVGEGEKAKKPESGDEIPAKLSEEEIDKTIENLVVE